MERIRPSLRHCLWGVPFILFGGGFFGYALFHGLMHVTDSLTQVVVPGSAELNLQPGQYSVFLEEQSIASGKIFSTTQSIDGLACRVNSAQDGASIAIERSSANVSYSANGRSGHSVLEFSIHQGGNTRSRATPIKTPKDPRWLLQPVPELAKLSFAPSWQGSELSSGAWAPARSSFS